MAWYKNSYSEATASGGLFATQIVVETAEIEDVQPLEPEQES